MNHRKEIVPVITMFRANVAAEHASDVEEAVKSLFAAIDRAKPQGVRYSSYLLDGGGTYIIMLELLDEGGNPLAGIPEFLAFQGNLKGWLAEPAVVARLTAVGEYRSF
jgi:hypothetical protein